MLTITLALALGVGPAATEANWRPPSCSAGGEMPANEVSIAQGEATRGNIGASVSLECHHLASGDESGAVGWLRQSALRDPLTGSRYLRYLLSVGDKESCQSALELTEKYLALDWLPDDVHREITSQRERAYGCR